MTDTPRKLRNLATARFTLGSLICDLLEQAADEIEQIEPLQQIREQKLMLRDGAVLLRHLIDDTRHQATSLDDEAERVERVAAWCDQGEAYLAQFPPARDDGEPDDAEDMPIV